MKTRAQARFRRLLAAALPLLLAPVPALLAQSASVLATPEDVRGLLRDAQASALPSAPVSQSQRSPSYYVSILNGWKTENNAFQAKDEGDGACQTPTKREFKFGFSSESFVDLHVLGFTLLNEVLGDKEDVIWSPAFSF